MAAVRKVIDINAPLTEEELHELTMAAKQPIAYDDDCPELTEEQLQEFAEQAKEQRESRRKKVVALRISPQTLAKAKKFGKGYTGVLSGILEKALNNPEILKQCL